MRTHNLLSGLLLFALVGLLWGCSGIQVSQDYTVPSDFSALKTYDWLTKIQPETGDIRVDSSLLDSRIRSAIDASLSQEGYQRITQGKADFYVAYTYEIHSKVESSNVTVGFGMGSLGGYGALGMNTGGNAREYDEGMLVIDLYDPSKENLLWRGIGTSRVDQHPKPEKAAARIKEKVEKILSQFPPQPD
ncbi:MAG: DUF4136 domain-containing protein [Deltaproteobacteria bacterium]|nr:DUF4136 domain-containing protein [Deltaproteobacteria bacterium]